MDDLDAAAQPKCPDCETVLTDMGIAFECGWCGLVFEPGWDTDVLGE